MHVVSHSKRPDSLIPRRLKKGPSNNGPQIFEIERRREITTEAFREDFDLPARPLIISGSIDHWKAIQRWSPEWFRLNYGNRVVPVAIGSRLESRWEQMPLRNFIDSMKLSTDAGYLRQFPILNHFPELAADFETPVYCPRNRRVVTNLWLGPSGTVQPLHKDNHNPLAVVNNIFVQIFGRKRFLLISGDQDALVYQRGPHQTDYHYSQIDVEHPDFERFPLFRQAKIFAGTVGPGEIIFIPANTWHHVRSLDQSISLSFWWNPSKIVDLISRLASAADQPAIAEVLDQEITITSADVHEFGGFDVLARAIRTLPAERRTLFLSLCEAEVINGVPS